MLVTLLWSSTDAPRAMKNWGCPLHVFPAKDEQGNTTFLFPISYYKQVSFLLTIIQLDVFSFVVLFIGHFSL